MPVDSAGPGFMARLEARILANTAEMVAAWGASVSDLTAWEDDNLLDGRTPELLARHKAAVERLMRFGVYLSMATEQPDFPDPALRAEVAATIEDLRERLAMWHRPRISKEAADRILAPIALP